MGMRTGCSSMITAAMLAGFAAPGAHAGAVGAELTSALTTRASHADVPVLIRFADKLDPAPYAVKDRRRRDNALAVALHERWQRTQGPLKAFLADHGAKRVKDLWLINGVAATVSANLVGQLAAFPGVEIVELDSSLRRSGVVRPRSAQTPQPDAALPANGDIPAQRVAAEAKSALPAWNIAAVNAPALWHTGITGRGVIVANMDTGVDVNHPDLAPRWRGGGHSWFDPHGQHAAPYDASGHGTQTMGIMVGGSASGSAIGVVPDARWIAVKLFNDAGEASLSDIHVAFQWLMDPDDDPTTVDSPDVVNASWNLGGRAIGACNLEFDDDIRVLRAAGIAVVFAAGNDGPAAGTSDSPGNNPQGFSVGAVDRHLAVARNASRGPSACDGAVFPTLVAPGVNVRTADRSYGGLPSYSVVSGASFAAPHAAGVLALLASAFPHASVDELESAVVRSAWQPATSEGVTSYGNGLADAVAAYSALAADAGSASTAPQAAYADGDGCLHERRHGAVDSRLAAQVGSTSTAPLRLGITRAGQ